MVGQVLDLPIFRTNDFYQGLRATVSWANLTEHLTRDGGERQRRADEGIGRGHCPASPRGDRPTNRRYRIEK